jgi:GH35 family endo-1,4-beta-xylanase
MKKKLLTNKKIISTLLLLFFFILSHAQTLRQVAASKSKFIGNIMGTGFINDNNTQGGNLNTIANTEYNVLTAENAMKMDAVLRTRPANPFNVTVNDLYKVEIDRFLNYGGTSMRKRGHAMIWFSQAPGWLQTESPNWSAQQIYDFSRTYITALATYTRGRIQEWDVLNEAIDDAGTANYRNAWYSRVNTQANNSAQIGYLTYFGSLFSWARAADANVKLFYNDYSIEQFGTSKNNFMRTMVKAMRNSTAPITGVGFQSHFILDNNGMGDGFIGQVGQSIDDLGSAGLEVVLTELDLRRCNTSPGTDALQRSAYDRIIKMALGKTNCNSVVIWGLSDNNSWIPQFFSGCSNATLHNGSYQKKEAYFGVLSGLTALGGGGGGTTTTIPNGNYYIKKATSNLYLNATAAVGATNKVTTRGAASTQWNFRSLGNNEYEIKSVAFSNSRMEIPNGITGRGQLISTTTYTGAGNNLIWIAVKVGSSYQFIPKHDQTMAIDMYEGNAVVHTWDKNTTNANQLLQLISTTTNTPLIAARNMAELETVKSESDFIVSTISGTAKTFRVTLPADINTLNVMDISGRQIKKIQVNGKRVIDVDINNASGIYIIQAVSATKSMSKKIVIE